MLSRIVSTRAGRASAALLLFATSALAGSGCAEERDPISRVQPNALPKSFFLGASYGDTKDDPEFYFRTTVVDVSAGAGSEELFTASDAQPTVRIRWDVQEDQLIARLSYELVDGTDKKGTTGAPRADEPRAADPSQPAPPRRTNDGQVVAAFKILKHFDIQRDYNVQTGEENNVIVENDVDRPWSARDFMRVDFSKNLVNDAYDLDAFSQIGLYGAVKWDPVSFDVRDPEDPDAPKIDLSAGYFDVTNKSLAAPQVIHDEEFGDFPACWLLGNFPQVSCNPSEVKLRLAFKKVVDTDYEALDFDGRRMDLFGYFTNDRYGYDRRYGIVDDRWHRFASRWNVWEKSHVDPVVECATTRVTPPGASPHRDENENGVEDECEKVGRGSRCDEHRHACTIPLRDRKVKTTVWHVNRGFPEDLFAGAKKVVAEWSNAIRVGIVAGRLAECRRTKESGCEAQMGWPGGWSDDYVPPVGTASPAQVPEVFVLCHNPVDPTKDDPACGKEKVSPRVGDLRYNLFSLVESPQVQSPWGIMVDAEDPLTGEKIAGSVNQWSGTLDRAAGSLTDLVQLLNGEIKADAFIKGQNVAAWVGEQNRNALPSPVSAEEVSGRKASFDPAAMAPFATGAKKSVRKAPAPVRHKARLDDLARAGKLGQGDAAIQQRMQKLRGTDLEAKLVTPEVMQAAGFDPRLAPTADRVKTASPFTSKMNPRVRRSLEKRALVGRAKRHSCRRDGPESDHLLGLARKAQRLFGAANPADPAAVRDHRDKIYDWARKEYSVSVFSHEFGHSVGLRHNFAGTFDSLNYANEYWQLRTKNGSVTKACAPGTTDGAGCVGPRYNDPLTAEEVDNVINGYATSSVMDYPGDQTLDMFVIGKYDRAAVRFGYGGTVDVWADAGVSVNGAGDAQKKAWALTGFADSVGLFGVFSFPQPKGADARSIHYSAYAAEFGLVRDCQASATSPIGSACRGAPLDVVDYRDMKDFVSEPAYPTFATPRAVDAGGRVRRGYMFSSDEYADSGNVPSFSYDAGADAYEQVLFLENAYENRYPLDAFRRNRTMFNSDDVVIRTQSHYLDAIQNIAKTFGFAMVLEVDDPAAPPVEVLSDGRYGPLAVASSHAFDLFSRMLTRPEPGVYCSTGADDCPNSAPPGIEDDIFVVDSVPAPTLTKYAFDVPLGTGRYVHNDFDYSQGYWWSDYQSQVGSFYDKTWAIYYMAEAFDSFISNSREDFLDGRYKNVNFATVYPAQVQRLFASLLTGDVETYAPWTDAPSTAAPARISYPGWRNPTTLGTRPNTSKIVDPSWGFNEQLYAMVWGTMLFPTSWSNGFIDDARIVSRPGESITWPATETYTFFDPATGISYRARSTGTETHFGKTREKSVGARMLEWANNLVYEAYKVEVDAQGFYKLNADGTPKLALKDGKPQVNTDFPGGVTALKRYVVQIELMRQLVNQFVRSPDEILPTP
ncbi:MAG: hypothetical protein JNL38_06955 [Myxococcales bacterium]|nr:hypothetical protein [Myxococcales bacterium]